MCLDKCGVLDEYCVLDEVNDDEDNRHLGNELFQEPKTIKGKKLYKVD